MKTILGVMSLALLTAGAQACALGSLASVTIIDRDTGAVLSTHYSRGEYWVAGTPGARYAVEVRNNSGARILAVTSVDGVNVISGASAGWGQSGYVLDGGERYQITGWRKSDAQVAAFTFTDAASSYAQRTGRPANVGVIGVALFRERAPPPPACCADGRLDRAAPETDSARERSQQPTDSVAANATPPVAGAAAPAPAPAAKLGTGHGAREESQVQQTQFTRQQSEPNELIRIRYDSLDNLVAMGIIRRPRPGVPQLEPFPQSRPPQYVADPPG